MHLIVITSEYDLMKEFEIVDSFFKEGLECLHLRKPEYIPYTFREYLKAINPAFHSKIVIHDAYPLAKEFGLAGIHLNANKRNSLSEGITMGKGLGEFKSGILSTSCHSWEDVYQWGDVFNSMLISPVFDSISKKDYKKGITLKMAKEVKKKFRKMGKRCPALIALGGITAEKIPLLEEHGFDGVALLGGIWKEANPVQEFKRALKAVNI